ncbi:hypothetical protein [uncultured Hyphomonas sp.]|uniref:hypothetical protein n=1 Tax=uncultured Hyphomonas sp. TaxID=225298 RepID=UPI00261953EA|nr:hypothetical protein [uncultured Hyphomonas sp.]
MTTSKSASVPRDTPIRNAMLKAAAGVLSDAYTHGLAEIRGLARPPQPKSPFLKAEPTVLPALGDNTPLTPEGRKSLEQYWEVYEQVKQDSTTPVKAKTLERRRVAWTEFHELTGSSLPIFKVQKSHIWAYRDALKRAPARSGSISELRRLSFPEKLKKARNGSNYAKLDPGTIKDRLRQIQVVLQLAVIRGHLVSNPAVGVTESSSVTRPSRRAYTTKELNVIFTSAPFDRVWPLEDDNTTDLPTYWFTAIRSGSRYGYFSTV